MAGTPAKALPACQNGILIQDIVTMGFYDCSLDTIDYSFNSSIIELASKPNSAIFFTSTSMTQTISFQPLENLDPVIFNFTMRSPFDSVLAIDQGYQFLDPATAPPSVPPTGVAATVPIPTTPSSLPFIVNVDFTPDYSITPPDPTIIQLTYTIHKTPAPLPFLGSALAFAFQRKLRHRIKLAS